MNGLIQRWQPLIGYLSAAILALGAYGPLADSSLIGHFDFAGGQPDRFFLLCAATASLLMVLFRKFSWLWLPAVMAGLICLLALITVFFETDAGRGQFMALFPGTAFVDFEYSYWGSLSIGWGVGAVILGVLGLALAAWPASSGGKVYDILVALPLIAFFLRAARRDFSFITLRLDQLMEGSATALTTLQMLAVSASILFGLLLILLIFARSVPVRKSRGFGPRVIAILGTFLGTAFLYLEPIALPLGMQIVATVMIITGMLFSFLVLMKLGRSFSIMPEARTLITTGPYAIVRHPLYMVEEIAIFGMLVQFAGPFALGFAIAHITLQYMRTVYEEEVLTTTFPEYENYRQRTRWRFIPGVV